MSNEVLNRSFDSKTPSTDSAPVPQQQSPFCGETQGTLTKELFRYIKYDYDFFQNYTAAALGFLVVAAISFHFGGVGAPVKSSSEMAEFIETIRGILDGNSTSLAAKALEIRRESKRGSLKLWRFQMFESISPADLVSTKLPKALHEQSRDISEIFGELMTLPYHNCSQLTEKLNHDWVEIIFSEKEECTLEDLAELATKYINETAVLPFFVKVGEFKDERCLEFSPDIYKLYNSDNDSKLIENEWFCQGTRSGVISKDVFAALQEK